jgi:hypothetical protein
MQMAQRRENCPRADTFDGLPVDARQSGVIAEPSFLEDESSPAGFRRFAQHPENSDVGSEAEAAEHGMLWFPEAAYSSIRYHQSDGEFRCKREG